MTDRYHHTDLENVAQVYLHGSLLTIALDVIYDLNFQKAPGSGGNHHAYEGGLVSHTYEVVDNAIVFGSAGTLYRVRMDILVLAAILHDYEKIHEYRINEDGTIDKLPYRRLIHHVHGSFAHFLKLADKHGLYDDWRKEQIGHCILAHHGRPEWGSSIYPQTPEAMLLHHADMMSAFFGKTSKSTKEKKA